MQYLSTDELNMKGAFLKNCDLSYLIACHCNFADATFDHCDLFNGRATNCCFENTTFFRTELSDEYIDPINDSISERQWNEDNDNTMEQEMQ